MKKLDIIIINPTENDLGKTVTYESNDSANILKALINNMVYLDISQSKIDYSIGIYLSKLQDKVIEKQYYKNNKDIIDIILSIENALIGLNQTFQDEDDVDKFDNYNFYGKYRGADYRMHVYLSKLGCGVKRKEYYDDNEAALSAILGIEMVIVSLKAIVSDGGGTVNLTHKATDNIPKLKAMRNDLLFPLVKASPELAEDLLNEITFNNSYITYDKGSDSDEK